MSKKLYDIILGHLEKNQEPDIDRIEALGYANVSDQETNDLKLGSSDVNRVSLCEDTVFVPAVSFFSAEVLIIGGGGGGYGSSATNGFGGGGGGAGGYRTFTKKYFTDIKYTVTVGAGGSASSIGSDSSIEKVSTGGGTGNGQQGGSGGGGWAFGIITAGGSSANPRCNGSSQGNSGAGATTFGFGGHGGGGGGAGASGSSANGGNGTASTITGSSVTRAGGGGGGGCTGGFGGTPNPGSGGSGGGGDGGSGNQSNDTTAAAGDNGTANTGGGGGGGAYYKDSPSGLNLGGDGGNGGSGFVVIKFPDSYSITIGGGLTYTSSTSGGYTTVQFTAGTDTIEFFWNPASISGLELWLDADDSETITLNGSTVSQWDDKSGNNYDVIQSTASEQPVYQSAALNSRNVVRFDGANDGLINTTDTPVGGSTNRTVFVVFNFTAFISPKYALTLGYNGGSLGTAFGISEEIGVRVGDGNRVFNTSVDSTHAIVTIMLDGTSTTDLLAWKNGSSLGVSSTGARTLNTSSGIGVGRSGGGAYLQGDVAEVIVYNSALSTSDRESVESYLSTKWGIS